MILVLTVCTNTAANEQVDFPACSIDFDVYCVECMIRTIKSLGVDNQMFLLFAPAQRLAECAIYKLFSPYTSPTFKKCTPLLLGSGTVCKGIVAVLSLILQLAAVLVKQVELNNILKIFKIVHNCV